jgi:two-component system sensor histidine kinase YesM
MKEAADGKFDIAIPAQGQREIQLLYRSFETMLHEIKELMNNVITEQEMLKKTELKALQEQINPHFLYNSMACAIWAAETGNNQQTIDLLISLSNFYKLTLSGGLDIVQLDAELDHVRNYLDIIQMRYQDLISYAIKTDSCALDIRFPKIILQPIVENAVYHGIKLKRFTDNEKGLIQINIYRDGSLLNIEIKDNGIGINPEELKILWDSIHSMTGGGKGYGLLNINQRLRLFFGEQYRLSISSIPNIGTTVTICVPSLRYEGETK